MKEIGSLQSVFGLKIINWSRSLCNTILQGVKMVNQAQIIYLLKAP